MISMHASQVFDWLVSVVNFAIMFSLFRLVVIIPMEQAVRLRRQRVSLRLKEIEAIRVEAEAKQAEFQEKFGNVEAMLSEIKVNADRSLVQAKGKIEEKAEAEERYVLDKARAEAESLRREVENEIRARIAAEAVAMAERILTSSLDAGAQNAIVTAGVKKVGELSAT